MCDCRSVPERPFRLPCSMTRFARPADRCLAVLVVLVAGEFVRRGCSVTLYDHTEYTRTRAFQTLRASLGPCVLMPSLWPCTPLPVCYRARSGHHGKHEAAAVQASPHALASALCSQVANGYLLKQDVEEIMVRISVSTLEEALERSGDSDRIGVRGRGAKTRAV